MLGELEISVVLQLSLKERSFSQALSRFCSFPMRPAQRCHQRHFFQIFWRMISRRMGHIG